MQSRLRAGALDDVRDVAPAPPRRDAVDADDLRLRGPLLAQRVDDVLARRVGLLRLGAPRPRGRGRPGRPAACGPWRASWGSSRGRRGRIGEGAFRDPRSPPVGAAARRRRWSRTLRAWSRCGFCWPATATRRAVPTIAGRPRTRSRRSVSARRRSSAGTSRRCAGRPRGSSPSPAVRARQTAEACARELRLEVSVDDRLIEFGVGCDLAVHAVGDVRADAVRRDLARRRLGLGRRERRRVLEPHGRGDRGGDRRRRRCRWSSPTAAPRPRSCATSCTSGPAPPTRSTSSCRTPGCPTCACATTAWAAAGRC